MRWDLVHSLAAARICKPVVLQVDWCCILSPGFSVYTVITHHECFHLRNSIMHAIRADTFQELFNQIASDDKHAAEATELLITLSGMSKLTRALVGEHLASCDHRHRIAAIRLLARVCSDFFLCGCGKSCVVVLVFLLFQWTHWFSADCCQFSGFLGQDLVDKMMSIVSEDWHPEVPLSWNLLFLYFVFLKTLYYLYNVKRSLNTPEIYCPRFV